MRLTFPEGELAWERASTPERAVALHRDTDWGLETFTASLSRVHGGAELLEALGRGSWPWTGRYFEPRPTAEAEALFEARVAARRAEGFAERALPEQTLVVRLPDQQPGGGAWLRCKLRVELAAALREKGLGRFLRSSVRSGVADLCFAVTDPNAATSAVDAWTPSLSLEGQFRVALLSDGAPRVVLPRRDTRPFPLESDPDVGVPDEGVPDGVASDQEAEPLAHVSKLVVTPDVGVGAAAARDAEEAVREAGARGAELDGTVGGLGALDALIGRLRASALAPDERERWVRLLGSYAGEVLRRAADGAWGIGVLFGSPVKAGPGLLLGRNGLKWWPFRELASQLSGQAASPLSARGRDFLARADAEGPASEGPPRLYALRAGEGGSTPGSRGTAGRC